MTYARSRLWLGITGVGLLVVLAIAALTTGILGRILPTETEFQSRDVIALCVVVIAFAVLMFPLDLLGGFVLPRRFHRSSQSLSVFLRHWVIGVGIQSALFAATGLAILTASRAGGLPAALLVVGLIAVLYISLQERLARFIARRSQVATPKPTERVNEHLERWGLATRRLIVVEHSDPGYTGGIVGIPGREAIVIPNQWVQSLTDEQLAAIVARRSAAISSGSRVRGLVLALAWVLAGFGCSSLLLGAGTDNVAGLVMTCCGFTLWSFGGLLILPTVSRRASYAVDRHVLDSGVPEQIFDSAIARLDQLQDDEPSRASAIEAIFHPVPSVNNRTSRIRTTGTGAWHAARMTLFLSWSCMGLLSRAVHCNAGRPELWVLLPTD